MMVGKALPPGRDSVSSAADPCPPALQDAPSDEFLQCVWRFLWVCFWVSGTAGWPPSSGTSPATPPPGTGSSPSVPPPRRSHTEEVLPSPSMTHTRTSIRAGATPLGVAAGFLGAFVVASLAVQLIRGAQPAAGTASAPDAAQVVAHQAALWETLARP